MYCCSGLLCKSLVIILSSMFELPFDPKDAAITTSAAVATEVNSMWIIIRIQINNLFAVI